MLPSLPTARRDVPCPDHPPPPWSRGASTPQNPGPGNAARTWHWGSHLSIHCWQEQSQLSQRGHRPRRGGHCPASSGKRLAPWAAASGCCSHRGPATAEQRVGILATASPAGAHTTVPQSRRPACAGADTVLNPIPCAGDPPGARGAAARQCRGAPVVPRGTGCSAVGDAAAPAPLASSCPSLSCSLSCSSSSLPCRALTSSVGRGQAVKARAGEVGGLSVPEFPGQ